MCEVSGSLQVTHVNGLGRENCEFGEFQGKDSRADLLERYGNLVSEWSP